MAQFVRCPNEDTRHVEGDVAVADDDRPLPSKVEGQIPIIRVAIVPADEITGLMRTGQIFARQPDLTPQRGPCGKNDGMIASAKIVETNIRADLDPADEAKARHLRDPLEDGGHLLQLGVIGSHAEPDQTVGHRQAFEQINRNVLIRPKQCFCRIKTAGSGPDDGDMVA